MMSFINSGGSTERDLSSLNRSIDLIITMLKGWIKLLNSTQNKTKQNNEKT